MALVRPFGLWLLLWSAPLPAQSVSIELTPRADLNLKVAAGDRSTTSALGMALGRSLGCTLIDVQEQARGAGWEFRAGCSGVFKRRGQVVDGQLKFAGFRQALIKAKVDEIEMDVGVPNAPYARAVFPRSWERTSHDGVVHRTTTAEPRELSARAIHVSTGYRTLELAVIFGPLPFTVLLGALLVAKLNRAAAKAVCMDLRALWFSYLNAAAWGLTGLFLIWAALWGAISGAVGGDMDVWALYNAWNGGSVWTGRMLAAFFYFTPALLVAELCMWWTPRAFVTLREPRYTTLDSMRVLVLPAASLIVPAYLTIGGFSALGNGDLLNAFLRLWLAFLSGMLLGVVQRRARTRRVTVLASGELWDRLRALAGRCGVELTQLQVAPLRAGVITEPLEAGDGRVAVSDYVLEKLEPAEIEAAVARQWSLPFRRFPDAGRVLVFLAALCVGMAVSLGTLVVVNVPLAALQLLLKIHTPVAPTQLAGPMAIAWAVLVWRLMQRWLARRADRRAVALVGNAEAVKSAAAKLAAMQMAPGKWGGSSGLPEVKFAVTELAPPSLPDPAEIQ
jgi:Zn-dependent protease with chaperone function